MHCLTSYPIVSGEIPAPRWGHAMAEMGGKVYLFGGSVGGRGATSGELYVYEGGLWRLLPVQGAQPSAAAHTLTAAGARLVLFGGAGGPDGALTFDNTWVWADGRAWARLRPAGPRPPARYGHSAAASAHHLIVFGGKGQTAYNDVWLLELESERWVRLETGGDVPPPLWGHSAALVDEKLLVFGGKSQGPGQASRCHADVWFLQPSSQSWGRLTLKGHPPAARRYHTMSLLPPRRLVVFGGGDDATFFADVHVLDLDELAWQVPSYVLPAPGARWGHAAALLPAGVLVFGGKAGERLCGDTLLLSLLPDTVEQWTEHDVSTWLASLGSQQYAPKFLEALVNGRMLLALSPAELGQLVPAPFHLKRLQLELDALRGRPALRPAPSAPGATPAATPAVLFPAPAPGAATPTPAVLFQTPPAPALAPTPAPAPAKLSAAPAPVPVPAPAPVTGVPAPSPTPAAPATAAAPAPKPAAAAAAAPATAPAPVLAPAPARQPSGARRSVAKAAAPAPTGRGRDPPPSASPAKKQRIRREDDEDDDDDDDEDEDGDGSEDDEDDDEHDDEDEGEGDE